MPISKKEILIKKEYAEKPMAKMDSQDHVLDIVLASKISKYLDQEIEGRFRTEIETIIVDLPDEITIGFSRNTIEATLNAVAHHYKHVDWDVSFTWGNCITFKFK